MFLKKLFLFVFIFQFAVAKNNESLESKSKSNQPATSAKAQPKKVDKKKLADNTKTNPAIKDNLSDQNDKSSSKETLDKILLDVQKQISDQAIVLENIKMQIGEVQKVQGVLVNRAKKAKEPKEASEKTPKVVKKENDKLKGKVILGSSEWGFLEKPEVNLRARVDTGASVSSVSASDLKIFERDGKKWARFTIINNYNDKKTKKEISKKYTIEEPIIRWSRVRQSSSEDTDKRPVIRTWLSVGPIRSNTELTLADRTHMSYPLLLGRSFFKDIAVVDVGKRYIYDKHEVKNNTEDKPKD